MLFRFFVRKFFIIIVIIFLIKQRHVLKQHFKAALLVLHFKSLFLIVQIYIKNQEENVVLFTSRPLLNSVQYICIVVYTLLV